MGLKLNPAGQPNLFSLLQAPSPRTKPFLNSQQVTATQIGFSISISNSQSNRENPPFLLSISLLAHQYPEARVYI
ncbi:hypothetical protein E1A91_D07G045900v1 [Gossypium mustelinum]|uniref:Uncharacterized protein n=1 Tax=Gossypium mustelinum TaxID=34275 RepID=A0A5D2U6N5_GOSMU|nr:hypothetical protein E1A91_D07G045900v1 [Gossypium mustelinum]